MANILRNYDFNLEHIERKNKVTFYDLAKEHPEIQGLTSTSKTKSKSLHWEIALDAFKLKFSNDLNSEKLKNNKTQRIVKRGYELDKRNKVKLKEIKIDTKEFILFSTLNGGKITDKSVLEKVSNNQRKLQLLNGDRIYDELFFLIHLSFKCNKARLFILTRSNNFSLDSTIKSYFEKNMFKCKSFIKSKWNIYIPNELKEEALSRTVINNIAISKTKFFNDVELDDEYEIEIKLKSKKKSGFGKITQDLVDKFKKTHIKINGNEIDDNTGLVKFNITDPETKTNKSIVFGNTDDFIPKLSLEDKQILSSELSIDESKLKTICLEYINYNEKGTF